MKINQRSFPIAAMLLAALACGAASAQTASGNGSGPPTSHAMGQDHFDRRTTQSFIDQAAYSNRAEIAAARYVLDHTGSQAVKNFALKMIHDHTLALDQLQEVASKNGFVMPSGIDKKDLASMDALKQDEGARLDAAYSRDEARDHMDAVATFRSGAQNASIAPPVRFYASAILPKVEEHLRMAQQLVATESKAIAPSAEGRLIYLRGGPQSLDCRAIFVKV